MYLDPSFGGMLVQIIVALIAGGGAVLFGFRRQIAKFFKKDKTVAQNTAQTGGGEVVDMMEDSAP
jgi:hypothetical protein